jgi:ribonuclease P protein component
VTRPEGKAAPVLAGFSVPKKKFKSSVDRHRIRRLMVESWRLNKHTLTDSVPADKQLHLFFIFTDKAMPELETVQAAVVKGAAQLATIIENTLKKAHE